MQIALSLAEKAFSEGAVPVGALIVQDGDVVFQSHNSFTSPPNDLPDSIRHAEIGAIIGACKELGKNRLDGCEIYVTVEPCAMCLGAIELVRISKIVFGAYNSSFVSAQLRNPHVIPTPPFPGEIVGGVMETDCVQIIHRFFQAKRSG
jgi:tRNA(adenine34) deaminase